MAGKPFDATSKDRIDIEPLRPLGLHIPLGASPRLSGVPFVISQDVRRKIVDLG